MATAQSIENNQHECFVVTQCCRVGYRGCFVMKECAFISLRVSLPMTCFYNTLIISIIRFLPAVEMTALPFITNSVSRPPVKLLAASWQRFGVSCLPPAPVALHTSHCYARWRRVLYNSTPMSSRPEGGI